MATPPPLAPDMLIHERYRIIRPIGQGGMGAIYEAIDQRLGNTVALKQTLLSGAQLDRAFEREARLLANLRHPALPVVSDFFADGGGRFLVMQYIPGKDFAELLAERDAPFALADVLRWADQLLDALDYLHTQQPPVIHRDIKPQNMKLTPRGEIVLLDFGLAKGEAPQMGAISTASLVGYTPQYAPMEQIQGAGTGPRGDLYALAATLYHLLTNTSPANALERASARLAGQPDPLRPVEELNPQVPPAVSAALVQALALNADERPASAAVMRELLRQTAHPTATLVRPIANTGTTVVAPLSGQPAPLQSSASPWPVLGCVGGLVVLLLIAVVLGVSQLRNSTIGLLSDPPTAVPPATPIRPVPTLEPDAPPEPTEADVPEPTEADVAEPTEADIPSQAPTAPAGPASIVLTFGEEGTGQGFFEDARGVAVDGRGNIYVSEYENGRVQKFDSQGNFLASWMTRGKTPLQSLAADRAGNVYVARDGKITKYDGASGEVLATLADDGKSNMESVTVLPDGGLLAFSWLNRDDLVRLNAKGAEIGRVREVISGQTGDAELDASVAVDGLGNIFVLGQFNNAVFRFAPDGKYVNKFGSDGDQPGQFRAPSALAVDNQSHVYVADFKGIQIFDADGRYLDAIDLPGAVRALVFDAKNNLFVVTSQQHVYKLTLNNPT